MSDTIFRAVEARSDDLPRLQSFFEDNPEYFRIVEGEPPKPDVALSLWDMRPPEGWPFRDKRLVLFSDEAGRLVAMADVIVDLFVPGVWHIGLFIVATRLHGTGASRAIYGELEKSMAAQGARWSRLGVVVGNAPAERFWERLGYVDLYRRTGVAMGKRLNTLRAMVKPLAGGGLAEYLLLVDHDRAKVEEAGGHP